ncbi:MAG: hypothetical protein PWQ56_53 [Patescibacteria group bacterium]|nr:hypothetical protein [Patescibacteria group bacterium]
MEFRQSLFWDVDPSKIDVNKDAEYIIERILDFGHDDEVRWMWRFYDKELVKKVVNNSRSLKKETVNLWKLILEEK